MNFIRTYRLYFAFMVALIATVGSLSFSEIFGFVPCELCWFQRVLMYPLVFLLLIAIFKRDPNIDIYILPFTILGIIVSGYHILVQRLEFFQENSSCNIGVPCNAIYIEWFGFLTIPVMSFIAFLLITIFCVSQKSIEFPKKHMQSS